MPEGRSDGTSAHTYISRVLKMISSAEPESSKFLFREISAGEDAERMRASVALELRHFEADGQREERIRAARS
jgi:hypothetical protein